MSRGSTREYLLLAEAGLAFSDILRSLTTEPSRRLNVADAGTIAHGMSADLVIVNGRPDWDLRALADVSAVYLRGKQLFTSNAEEQTFWTEMDSVDYVASSDARRDVPPSPKPSGRSMPTP